MNQENSARFRILPGLPPDGPPAHQFTSGAKRTHTEGLVVEIEAPGASSWVGNFQLGLSTYSALARHPNGRDLVVVAGGLGYVVQPRDGKLVATFGGGVKGLWQSVDGTIIVFNDYDVSFSALGANGWRWKTRRISSTGFENLTFYSRRIEGRAWNVVDQRWEPFEVDLATGAVRGGVYFEMSQQAMAFDTEMKLRGAEPISPLIKRILEVVLGLLALALVLLTIYLTYDSVRTGELTWSRVVEYWGLAYFLVFLTGVVLLFGARLIVPRLGPNGRLVSRKEILVFFALYFAMILIVLLSSRG